MSERVRDEDGQFVETITPERVLGAMRAVDAPVVTASDIADELECTPEAVSKKLAQLQTQGRVARRPSAGRCAGCRLVANRATGA